MRLRLEYPFLSSVQVGTMYVEKSSLSRWISFLSHDAVLGLMLLRWEENPQSAHYTEAWNALSKVFQLSDRKYFGVFV